MYMVGVAAVLKNLGLVDSSTKIAGSSGGGVAGAMLCSDVATDKFMSTATALSLACGGSNCRGNLQSVVKAGMSAMLPADAHSRCSGRLFVSVTEATGNPAADVERKISSFASNSALIEALATTTYIPGYAGPSTVTYPTGLGVAAAYDGVSR
jgi:hypothetical protein